MKAHGRNGRNGWDGETRRTGWAGRNSRHKLKPSSTCRSRASCMRFERAATVMSPCGVVNCKVLGPPGPLLTNRMTQLVTYGSVGGVGRKPDPYPAAQRPIPRNFLGDDIKDLRALVLGLADESDPVSIWLMERLAGRIRALLACEEFPDAEEVARSRMGQQQLRPEFASGRADQRYLDFQSGVSLSRVAI